MKRGMTVVEGDDVESCSLKRTRRLKQTRRGWMLGLSVWFCRGLLAIILIQAGVSKMFDPAGFALSIHRYQLLPMWTESPAAIIVPWLETVLGVALLTTRRWRLAAAVLTLGLLLSFTAMLAWAWFHNLNISCGCSPAPGSIGSFASRLHGTLNHFLSGMLEDKRIGVWHFVRNSILLAAVAWLLCVDLFAYKKGWRHGCATEMQP